MRLSGGKKPVIITNYYNKSVLLPLCNNKCDWNKLKSDISCLTKNMVVCSQSNVLHWQK
jgi:hypothetical protein